VFNRKLILATLSLALFMAACSGRPATPTSAPANNSGTGQTSPTAAPNAVVPTPANVSLSATVTANTTAPQTDANGEAIVARVNGEAITMTEYQRALARRQQEVNAADPSTLQNDVLDQLIENVLVRQGAAAQNISVSDQDVQTELKANIDTAGSESAWQQWLTTNLFTQDEFVQSLRVSLINNQVLDKLTQDLSGPVQQVHARHILVASEADANALLARLKAGEDFATLAKTFSKDDTTREQGGDLGWFTQDELLAPELAKAAFALKPGEIGGPVSTQLGFHIIQTLEFEDKPIDSDDRRVYIAQVRFENWIHELTNQAKIERYLPG
jgi:peptidyl-prolyl cis-trans isomerase C